MDFYQWLAHHLFGWQYVLVIGVRQFAYRTRLDGDGNPTVKFVDSGETHKLLSDGTLATGHRWVPLTFGVTLLQSPEGI